MNSKRPSKNFTVLLLLIFFLSCPLPSYAVGTATKCLVTVKKILLKNSEGNWFTLLNEDRKLDLSQENPSVEVINKKIIPPGEYLNCKIVISETLQVAGSDGPNKTKEGGEVWVEGTASKISELPGEITLLKESAPTWNSEDEGLITVHLNLDFSDRDDVMEVFGKRSFPKPLKIRDQSTIQVILSIPLAKTIRYVWANFWEKFPKNDTMYFLPPSGVEELSVKVDGITALVTSDIEWTF